MSQPHCPHRRIATHHENQMFLYCPDCKQIFSVQELACQTWRKVVQLIDLQKLHHHGLFCNVFGCDK